MNDMYMYMDKWMDGQTDICGWINEWYVHGQMDGWTDGYMWMNGYVDGQMDGWTDGYMWMNGYVHGQMDRWMQLL